MSAATKGGPEFAHLADIWEAMADAIADAPALIDERTSRSWSEFDNRAARLATALAALGVARGTVVAIDLLNCSEYLETYFAVLKLRAVPANLNYRYVGDELRQLLDITRAEVLVVHSSLINQVEHAVQRTTTVREVIAVDDLDGASKPDSWLDYEALIDGHGLCHRIERRADDIFLSFTGGTTGLPKAVSYQLGPTTVRSVLTRELIIGEPFPEGESPVDGALRLHNSGRGAVTIPASPLMHSTGLQFAAFPALVAGGCVVTDGSRRFDAHRILSSVVQHQATAIAIVGDAFARPLLRALDEAVEGGRPYDCSSLRCIASAGLTWSSDVKTAILDHITQIVVMEACGSTEGAQYGSQISRRGDIAATARFIPSPGVKLLDDAKREVAAGEIGRIAAPTIASGYLSDPEATARAFFTLDAQTYVIPGDFGRITTDGQLELLGRGTSVINRGGEKIFPEEVEQRILAHEAVEDVVVVGIADERLGQTVGAVVQARPDAALTAEAIGSHLEGRLGSYKRPRRIVFAVVPRFANGKPDFATAVDMLNDEPGP
jgi:3-oxocholest-4-en-26-oate---CoA ligase